ncbi:1487_t:CDS:1, partial [Acaulospora colombiana]
AARHANELEAAYASFYSSVADTATSEAGKEAGPTNASQSKEGMDLEDIQWYRDHPIVVRDYAFEEDDERFSKVPLELKPASERPPQHRIGIFTFFFSLRRVESHYGSSVGQHRWDVTYNEDEDEDEWGWPIGTITGGSVPLSAPITGGQRAELKNRSRAWNGLGNRGVGGRWTEISEEESSGFYEESGEEEHEDNEVPTPNDRDEEDDSFTGDVHTPLHPFSHSRLHDPHLDHEMDGVDGDEDSSPESSDREDYSLRPGIYRVLFAFTAESPAEMSVNEDQLIRVLGRGGGEGWVVALRSWTPEDTLPDMRALTEEANHEEEHGLVPESYIELYRAGISGDY